MLGISIHALREEGDIRKKKLGAIKIDFYPRPPRGGRLYVISGLSRLFFYFYPRPPRGGRRLLVIRGGLVALFLSTPSARRATLSSCSLSRTTEISIHALREEGDRVCFVFGKVVRIFLSTPSARRATWAERVLTIWGIFLSTPSARRATSGVQTQAATRLDFYPRPPRGGRPAGHSTGRRLGNFYPRPPRGGRPRPIRH